MDELTSERELLRRIRTEGIRVAYDTALAVCLDPKSAAPARATAAATIFRVAGLFERRAGDGPTRQAHEMTAEEITAEISRMQRAAKGKQPDIFD